jgi:hypothetical protein
VNTCVVISFGFRPQGKPYGAGSAACRTPHRHIRCPQHTPESVHIDCPASRRRPIVGRMSSTASDWQSTAGGLRAQRGATGYCIFIVLSMTGAGSRHCTFIAFAMAGAGESRPSNLRCRRDTKSNLFAHSVLHDCWNARLSRMIANATAVPPKTIINPRIRLRRCMGS